MSQPSSDSTANLIDVCWLSQKIGRPSIYNIVNRFVVLVENQEIAVGSILPSIRTLANELNVSATTVAAAMNQLKNRNIIQSNPGKNFVVIENPITATPLLFEERNSNNNEPTLLDLSYCVPDHALLPPLDKALHFALQNTSPYYYTQRLLITDQLKLAAQLTWPYATDSFMTINSAADAFSNIVKLLVPPNSYIAVENPISLHELVILKRANIKLIAVEYDQDGPIISSLAQALAKKPALFVFQPREHLATGRIISSVRLQEMAPLFKNSKTWIVENDIIGDLSAITPQSLGKFYPERTLHIRSYFQAYPADLCIALLSAPNEILQKFYNFRRYTQGFSSHLNQQALAYLLTDNVCQQQVAHARQCYFERYHQLCLAMQYYEIRLPPAAGVPLCLWLPANDEQLALKKLAAFGIIALAGSCFFVHPLNYSAIRLTVSVLSKPALITKVTEAIATICTNNWENKTFN